MPAISKRHSHPVRDAIVNVLTPPMISCLGNLSPQTARSLSRRLGDLAHFFCRGTRQLVRENIAIALPELTESQRDRIARQAIANSMLLGLEVFRLMKHPGELRSIVHAPDERLVELTKQTPVIVCLPHLGNWEVFGQSAPLFGIPSAAIAEPLQNARLNELLGNARTQNGLVIIPRDGAARKVMRCIHEKRSVGFLVDQNLSPKHGGIYASFFGLPVPCSPLPAALALRLGLPLIVAASVRRDDFTYEFQCEYLPYPLPPETTTESLTQLILNTFETIIRKYPEQYTWTYKRWRYIPDNLPEELVRKYPSYAVKRPYPCPQEIIDRLLI